MKNTKDDIDALPEDFGSEQAAADFWDTHSITDYDKILEPVEFEAHIERRRFEIKENEGGTRPSQ